MKVIFTLLLSLTLSTLNFAENTPQVSSGHLDVVSQFQSEYIGARTVYVWLPEGYKSSEHYSVLYMHDGQMLFDARTTWNNQEWGVDEVVGKLIAEGKVRNFIVVGIENAGPELRGPEYFPQRATDYIGDASLFAQHKYLSAELNANNYLKFIVNELKPYLARQYSVKTDREHSFIAGSSMGGLISLYAISEYPNEFAAAACLSTHWPGSTPGPGSEPITQAILDYMRDNLPAPANHRLYFDFGTETLDKYYPPLQARADRVLKAKGYDNSNWRTREFVGAAHDETSWRARLDVPLLFLLGK